LFSKKTFLPKNISYMIKQDYDSQEI